MAKKTKSLVSRSLDQTENPNTQCDWTPTQILDSPDQHFTTMSSEKLSEIKALLPSGIVVIVPDSFVEANWFRKDWVCLYHYPIEIGITLLFSKLVNDVLATLAIAPRQLMPSAWRTLACLDSIISKHQLEIDVEVVKYAYTLKKINGCRFSLVNRKKDEPLILNNDTVNDRGWKNEFFFFEKNFLGDGSQSLLDRWNNLDPSFEIEGDSTAVRVIIDKILGLPIGDKLWPNCLNRSIRNASVVDISDFVNKSNKAIIKHSSSAADKALSKNTANRTRSKQFSATTPLNRPSLSIHSLSSETDESPKSVKDVEFSSGLQYAKEFKSPVIRPLIISSRDLFAKRSREDKSGETGSSKASVLVTPGSSPPTKRVKVQSVANTIKSESTSPLITYGYDTTDDPSVCAHLLGDLLLPQTKDDYSKKEFDEILDQSAGYTFYALQSTLAARDIYQSYVKRFRDLEERHSNYDTKLQEALDLTSDRLKSLESMKVEFDDFAMKVKDLESTMHDQAQKLLTQQVMRARVETMFEFRRGEWTVEDIPDTVKIYNDAYPSDAFVVGEAATETNADKSTLVATSVKDQE